MKNIVLTKLDEIHNEYWGSGKSVSAQTSRAQKLTAVWQKRLVEVDSTRYKPEFIANNEAGGRSHKIDLVDTVEKVAYELKVSENNPHFEFYKDVFKVLYANCSEKIIDKLVFCCPSNAEKKLGSLANYVTTLSDKLDLIVEIYYIENKNS